MDDERTIALTTSLILNKHGYEAAYFYNPLHLLSAMDAEKPELVLSDVVMPQMTGIELALRLREEYPACKVVLFSGQALTSDLLADATRQGHSFDVLPKPLHPHDLLRAIQSRLEPEDEGVAENSADSFGDSLPK